MSHDPGAVAMLTPADVHHDRAPEMLAQRESTLQQAWSEHPERFVKGIPKPQPLPTEVWINPPAAASTPQPAQYPDHMTPDVSLTLSTTGSESVGIESETRDDGTFRYAAIYLTGGQCPVQYL